MRRLVFEIFDCRARMSAVVDLGIRALFSCFLLLSGPYLHGAYKVDNRAPVEDLDAVSMHEPASHRFLSQRRTIGACCLRCGH